MLKKLIIMNLVIFLSCPLQASNYTPLDPNIFTNNTPLQLDGAVSNLSKQQSVQIITGNVSITVKIDKMTTYVGMKDSSKDAKDNKVYLSCNGNESPLKFFTEVFQLGNAALCAIQQREIKEEQKKLNEDIANLNYKIDNLNKEKTQKLEALKNLDQKK